MINNTRKTNWAISWIITLQYDTTIDQLKTIRDEIEDYINKGDDYDQSVGVAVRIDKFSDSSIDMYVRCFTKTNSWTNYLQVKENLALEIKKIVEGKGAAFAFPSQSIYVEKNDCYILFSSSNFKTLFICCNCQCRYKLVSCF